MSVIFRKLTKLRRRKLTFDASLSGNHSSNETLKMSETKKKLLVTRMEEDIPKPAIEILQKQLIHLKKFI